MDTRPVTRQRASDGPPASAETLLAAARAGLRRLSPPEAREAMRNGTLLIDIRSDRQRAADGIIPGSHFVARNVLEWRLDPACRHRDPLLGDPSRGLMLICDEGFQSSLAAATLQTYGQREVADVIGGFRAWRAAGLPVQRRMNSSGACMRAIDCPCGEHLLGTDDDDLLDHARAHVEGEHPGLERTDDQLRLRIVDDAYDAAGEA